MWNKLLDMVGDHLLWSLYFRGRFQTYFKWDIIMRKEALQGGGDLGTAKGGWGKGEVR